MLIQEILVEILFYSQVMSIMLTELLGLSLELDSHVINIQTLQA